MVVRADEGRRRWASVLHKTSSSYPAQIANSLPPYRTPLRHTTALLFKAFPPMMASRLRLLERTLTGVRFYMVRGVY